MNLTHEFLIHEHYQKGTPVAAVYNEAKREKVLDIYPSKFAYFTISTIKYSFIKPIIIAHSSSDLIAEEIEKNYWHMSYEKHMKFQIEAACSIAIKEINKQIEELEKRS